MKEIDMTEAFFARQIGASRSTVNDWKNKKQNPSSNRLMKICEVLDMTPEELLAGTEYTRVKIKKKVLTEKEKELVQIYDDVSDSTKQRLLEYAKRLRRMESKGEI